MKRENVVYMVDCKVCGKSYKDEIAPKFADRSDQDQRCINSKKKRKNGFYMHIKKSPGRKHKN